MDRETFLAARRYSIGGSDACAACGLSPYKTRRELYAEKVGELVQPDEPSERMLFGTLLEDVIAQETARRLDVKVRRRNAQLVHRQYPHMTAHVDRVIEGLVEGRKVGVECKAADLLAYRYGDWGPEEDGAEGIPLPYLFQTAHYLSVCDFDRWILAVLVGGNALKIYHIERDREFEQLMVEQEYEFWGYVQRREPPPLDPEHASAIPLLRKLYPATNGRTIRLDVQAVHWHAVRSEAMARIRRDEQVRDGATAWLLEALGDNAIGELPEGLGSYRRKTVKVKEYTVPASERMDFRFIKPKGDDHE